MAQDFLRHRLALSDQIARLCKEAGCSDSIATLHRNQFIKKKWHPHPQKSFVQWWEPWGFDSKTGASKGGHEKAYRLWARPEPDGSYAHGWYGVKTVEAWNDKEYFEQYREWLNAGMSSRAKDFISIAATLERQKEYQVAAAPLVVWIGKDGQIPKATLKSLTDELNRRFPGYDPSIPK
jgi:hypothetical protein